MHSAHSLEVNETNKRIINLCNDTTKKNNSSHTAQSTQHTQYFFDFFFFRPAFYYLIFTVSTSQCWSSKKRLKFWIDELLSAEGVCTCALCIGVAIPLNFSTSCHIPADRVSTRLFNDGQEFTYSVKSHHCRNSVWKRRKKRVFAHCAKREECTKQSNGVQSALAKTNIDSNKSNNWCELVAISQRACDKPNSQPSGRAEEM